MRKGLLQISFAFVCVLFLCSILVHAADAPPSVAAITGVSDTSVQKVQSGFDALPIANNGSFDPSKLKPIQSKAELRIKAINDWLNKYTTLFFIVFGMTPQVSWQFAFVFLFWLFFVVVLILNAPTYWKSVMPHMSDGSAYGLGLGMFAIFCIVFRFPLILGSLINGLLDKWWGKAILVVIFIFGEVIASKLMSFWNKSIMGRNEKGDKEQEAFNRKLLDK
ncbi:MAG: hypothetical protein WCP89_03875, partial [archaeon]